MNDFGTVYKRTIGIDSNGFLIRMFPKVVYRPIRKDRPGKPYLHLGQCCLLPLDSCAPERMMREVYGFTDDEVERCMNGLISTPVQQYLDMDETTFDKLHMAERQAVKCAVRDGSSVVWRTKPQQRAIPLEDGVVVLLLYRRQTIVPSHQHPNYDYEEDFVPRRKVGHEELKRKYTPELQEAFKEHCKSFAVASHHNVDNATYGDWIVPEVLNGPGERWSSYAFDSALVPMIDRIAHNIIGQFGWQTHMHDKVAQALNEHTHTTYDTTFSIYF